MTQTRETIEVTTDTNEYVLVGRPCELSAFSFVPTRRCDPKERNVFNAKRQDRYSESTYDRLYHHDYGFEQKLHRCDREYAKSRGLNINAEENTKAVPTRSSSNYGHKLEPQIDKPDRKHVRIGIVQSEFFRRNGINVDSQQTGASS